MHALPRVNPDQPPPARHPVEGQPILQRDGLLDRIFLDFSGLEGRPGSQLDEPFLQTAVLPGLFRMNIGER
jgi:hypothetical protein